MQFLVLLSFHIGPWLDGFLLPKLHSSPASKASLPKQTVENFLSFYRHHHVAPARHSPPIAADFNLRRFKEKGKECSKHPLKETDEESGSSDGEFDGIVQTDFSFFDPKPDDFHGVKMLLQSYLNDREWDLSGFVDLILGQPTVGTVVKIEDDEDSGLFAVISALNLGRYKNHKCIKELKEFLMQVCPENISNDLQSLLREQAQNVGLLVSQRFANLPPQLFPPFYDALFDEV